ncbi:MAG: ABC transporter permease [Saprospiraceae bacterium]
MFDLDKWQEIFNTISKHKLRTFLTALGVFWGIFMLVFLMGSAQGLENGVMGMFGGHAKNSMYAGSNRTTLPYKGLPPGRVARLTMEDMTAIKVKFSDQIEYLAPRLWMSAGEVTRKNKRGSFDVRGDMPSLVHIDAIQIGEGRFLNDFDVKYRRKIAVIGKRVSKELFEEGEEVVGSSIRIRGADYRVVGILESDRKGEDAEDDETTIFIPLTTVQQVTNQPNEIGWFVCSMYPHVTVSNIEEGIVNLLKSRHDISPEDNRGIWSENVEEQFREIMALFFGIKFITWFVGIGSLFAGVIGVGNIMLIVVKERTKEIGIRKAMGATPGSIISMILMESVFITTIAGYLGLAFSTMIIILMNLAVGEGDEFFANPEVDLNVGAAAIVVLVIAGAIAGLIPAMQAANIHPVEALRDE